MVWHIVINRDGKLLGVFGEALRADADNLVERLGHLFASVKTISGRRPHVGEFIGNLNDTGNR